jgi:shikimate kinase
MALIGGPVVLIGPGGAGKSATGVLVANRLGVPFVDLDRRFEARAGNIGGYIDRFGYRAYARYNVDTYAALIHEGGGQLVAALSSGFMTYPPDIHPEYARLRHEIEQSPNTFVLIPSLDGDTCAAETVRRQLLRPFARSAAREEAVIRERFPIYVGLRARKIETMRTATAVVDEISASINGRLDTKDTKDTKEIHPNTFVSFVSFVS